MDSPLPRLPPALVAHLRAARRVTALTGAGMSAESGVPTFRAAQRGLWAQFSPEELATPEAFVRHPRRVWDWYAWRRELVARAQPNPGHEALARLAGRYPAFQLITQNVDNLHQRAGSPAVIELHGNLARFQCLAAAHPIAQAPTTDHPPPPCPRCGSPLRPAVVWFGEALPADAWAQAQAASRTCDLFLCIGTSGLVYPAAALPALAVDAGAVLVEINPEPTPLSAVANHCLRGPAGRVLPSLLADLDQA